MGSTRSIRHTEAAAGATLKVSREGELVGFCAYGPPRDDDLAPGTGEVVSLYVHPDHQRGGVGRALLQAAAAQLKARRMNDQVLWVIEANAPARAFYENIGWRPDRTRRGFTAPKVRYARAAR